MENKERSGDMNSKILNVNGLFYKMPQPLSTSIVSTWKKQYASRNEYQPSQTVVFDLNCNAAVDPKKSYFKVNVLGLLSNSVLNAGVMSCIREVRILSKNGSELDRISNFNHWGHFYSRNIVPLETYEDDAVMAGFGATIVTTTATTFILPLHYLSGLFRPHGGVKLPPQLLSGCRIEMVLEDANNALTAGAAASYTWLNPEIQLYEHTLSDSSLKVLSSESANNGLEITYPRVFVVSEVQGTNEQYDTQIKKAVSQCTQVITVPKLTSDQNNLAENSFRSIVSTAFSKFQFRLASSYFPNQEINDVREAYHISRSVKPLKEGRKALTDLGEYQNEDFYVGSIIKTDGDISSSGLAINNSASLAIKVETTGGLNKTFFTFMEYTALARCFLSQTSVKI